MDGTLWMQHGWMGPHGYNCLLHQRQNMYRFVKFWSWFWFLTTTTCHLPGPGTRSPVFRLYGRPTQSQPALIVPHPAGWIESAGTGHHCQIGPGGVGMDGVRWWLSMADGQWKVTVLIGGIHIHLLKLDEQMKVILFWSNGKSLGGEGW